MLQKNLLLVTMATKITPLASLLAILSLLSWAFLFALSQPSQAQGDVFIISQVRGDENCCDPGSVTNFTHQLTQLAKHGFAGNFLFRYDALLNQEIITAFKKAQKTNPQLHAGIWVEVTPMLAAASQVTYSGEPSRWYQAANSLLVGYTPATRRLLLDTLREQFNQAFPHEPLLLAGAWGIDTNSLNYLHQQGVKVFQTVREQYGTDSYTMDGSIINEPYYPSENWYVIPSRQPRDLIVIKHTISDPLHSYGDDTSSYTSQPNDYAHQELTTSDYFRPLLLQALNKHDGQRGWATIGLENSMSEQYQQEFAAQLDIVAELVAAKQAQVVSLTQVQERYLHHREVAPVRLSLGSDFTHAAQPLGCFWIETADYRLRFVLTQENLVLSDWRYYNPTYTDYYNTHVSESGFYAIVPPIYANNIHPQLVHIGKKTHQLNYYAPQKDVTAAFSKFKSTAAEKKPGITNGLKFPAIKAGTLVIESTHAAQINLSYQNNQQQQVNFSFHPHHWQTNTLPQQFGQPFTYEHLLPGIIMSKNEVGNYIFTPQQRQAQLALAQQQYSSLLLPEVKYQAAKAPTTLLYYHADKVFATLQPARLVIYPLNSNRFPVKPSNLRLITSPELTTTISEQNGEYLLVDFASSKAQKVKVTVYLDEQIINQHTINFIKDCQTQKCGFNLYYWWQFYLMKLRYRFFAP